jgi:hypothetical protein
VYFEIQDRPFEDPRGIGRRGKQFPHEQMGGKKARAALENTESP